MDYCAFLISVLLIIKFPFVYIVFFNGLKKNAQDCISILGLQHTYKSTFKEEQCTCQLEFDVKKGMGPRGEYVGRGRKGRMCCE